MECRQASERWARRSGTRSVFKYVVSLCHRIPAPPITVCLGCLVCEMGMMTGDYKGLILCTSSTEAHLGPIAVGSYSCGSHHPIKQPLKLGSEEVAHLECEPKRSVSASPEHSTLTLKFMAVQTKDPRGVHWRGQALGPVCTVHLHGEH